MSRTFTETRTVYQYDELPTEKAKDKAREWYCQASSSDEWWEQVYEDAKMVGIKITGFDIDRSSYCKGTFTKAVRTVAEAITNNHGKDCETYKTAAQFLLDFAALPVDEDGGRDINEEDDLSEEFKNSILEDYRIMLSHEYDYINSQEYVEDMIRCNEYEFNVNGSWV